MWWEILLYGIAGLSAVYSIYMVYSSEIVEYDYWKRPKRLNYVLNILLRALVLTGPGILAVLFGAALPIIAGAFFLMAALFKLKSFLRDRELEIKELNRQRESQQRQETRKNCNHHWTSGVTSTNVRFEQCTKCGASRGYDDSQSW